MDTETRLQQRVGLAGVALSEVLTPQLLASARRRDPEAIVAIYRALSSPLYTYLLHQTGDQAAADDLTAETFLEMLRSVDRFDGTADGFKAWLFRIAHNRLVDHFRRQARRRHEPIEAAADVPEPNLHPESEALARLERERIVATVRALPPDQRDVVLLRLVAGLPIAETAQLLGKTPGAVKALQHRALQRLSAVLAEADGGP